MSKTKLKKKYLQKIRKKLEFYKFLQKKKGKVENEKKWNTNFNLTGFSLIQKLMKKNKRKLHKKYQKMKKIYEKNLKNGIQINLKKKRK